MNRADASLVAAGTSLGLAAGLAVASRPFWGALVVGSAVLLMVTVTRPVLLGVLALVGSLAAQRLGTGGLPGGGSDISYADAFLALAVAVAVPSMVRAPELRQLRVPLVGLAVYLATLLPAVLLDDTSRGWVEWLHRLSVVGGSLVVGAWIAREEMTRPALRLLVALSCLLSVAAMVDAVQGGFEPADPFGLHKNFLGAQLSIVLVLTITGVRYVGLTRGQRLLVPVTLGLGLLATQSRGSAIAATAGILLVSAFGTRAQDRGARGLILLVTLALAAFTYTSLRADYDLNPADFRNSSIGQRQQVEERTREIWRTSPLTGVGLKYFNSGEWGPLAQPANIVVDNELAEAGLLGLGGFVVLQATAITAGLRRRRDRRFAVVGAACVAALLTHGLVDIYWIAGSAMLPFLLLGMALSSRNDVTHTPETERPRRILTLWGD